MSQVAETAAGPITVDPYEIGWYIESADEDIYGPVSRQALRHFLEDKTITPNTLVRHCTQPEARPAADQPIVMQNLNLEGKGTAIGDKLAETWPRKKRDRLALAEGSAPCAWHKRPATLYCIRCQAPYCDKCRAKPFRKQFYLCRYCQLRVYNKRILALFVDTVVLLYIPILILAVALAAAGLNDKNIGIILFYLVYLVLLCVYIFFRDSLFGGAGIGKRVAALRVVQTKDGSTPLTHRQGIVRWLSQFIPIYNLVDLSVPFRDPLLRRYGDRWAGTRVIDTNARLAKVQAKIARRLLKKGVQPAPAPGMTMEGLARIV